MTIFKQWFCFLVQIDFGQSWSKIQLQQPCYSGWYTNLRRKISSFDFQAELTHENPTIETNFVYGWVELRKLDKSRSRNRASLERNGSTCWQKKRWQFNSRKHVAFHPVSNRIPFCWTFCWAKNSTRRVPSCICQEYHIEMLSNIHKKVQEERNFLAQFITHPRGVFFWSPKWEKL